MTSQKAWETLVQVAWHGQTQSHCHWNSVWQREATLYGLMGNLWLKCRVKVAIGLVEECGAINVNKQDQDTWLCQTPPAGWWRKRGMDRPTDRPTDRQTDKAFCRTTAWVWQKYSYYVCVRLRCKILCLILMSLKSFLVAPDFNT